MVGGLTTDGEYLIASDGSSNIYFLNENCETEKTIKVLDKNNNEVENLNELEYINGKIWGECMENKLYCNYKSQNRKSRKENRLYEICNEIKWN